MINTGKKPEVDKQWIRMSTWMKKQTLIQPHNGIGPWKFFKNELLIHSTNWIDEFSNRYAKGKKQDKKKKPHVKSFYINMHMHLWKTIKCKLIYSDRKGVS